MISYEVGGNEMRQSRAKIRREYKGQKVGMIIVFVILLPIVSIGLGYLGAKYLILPNLFSKQIITEESDPKPKTVNAENHKDKEVPQSTKETPREAYVNTFEIQGLDIFAIQVGSFSTKENAQGLIEELNNRGMGGYIWHNNGYKVITAAMLDRESIDMCMTEIKKVYDEAFVVTQNIPTRAVRYGKEDSKYVTSLQDQNIKLIEIFQSLSKTIKQMETEGNDVKNTLALIQGHRENLKNMKKELNKISPNSDIQPIHNAFIKIIDDMNVGLEYDANSDAAENLAKIQNTFLAGLYQYSDFAHRNEY